MSAKKNRTSRERAPGATHGGRRGATQGKRASGATRGAGTQGTPCGASQRQLRVGEELRHALSEIFARGELRDPDLAGCSLTVTEVRASPDLRNATAYVVPLGAEGDKQLLAALARSAPFLRSRLAEMVQLRFSPKLDFAIDMSFNAARRIEEVLQQPEVARDLEAVPPKAGSSPVPPKAGSTPDDDEPPA